MGICYLYLVRSHRWCETIPESRLHKGGIIPKLQADARSQHDLIVGWYPIMRGGSPPCRHPQDPNHVPRNLSSKQRTPIVKTDCHSLHNSMDDPSS
jgi:hypothetical protein